ncbi:hypothetical protein A3A71_03150 [Candidatus Berkelbacteria bacterium RIFCSPLOWO2_01_FULL_50_28]|uniref:Uncharacterized protein n=1 Tax=Candidatus Berkelbacteria bacterium RIFCSPLOWO2_01_FULL_50_28 TaxID=1797471 RepID=A0A1F5ECC9_9BACT|nr:MAG: hypothetical protein A2807_02715 [Candidatus Berkelbacteria bacterium RIFCSPHIGHO2_01_FULL_50_36]OGD63789.1 MAG: hypothetical protein A3F39_03550 [Candidatus Berkelbacteria bacterium RIFCSPHIGHO2_12_FULL_50_11]OGD65062.1 MAG: hypothetical protein A3A71_03150 [Candidatus Berkelbacteria bacterium RIFCSPLOWO2_01_FULL_50_28]
MKAKPQLKDDAIKLRMKGLSYREIKQEIDVSKSTLSSWLKNILLSPEHKQRLYTKQVAILNLGSRSHHLRRQGEISRIIGSAQNEVSAFLSDETVKLLGAAIYWAEGTKKGTTRVTNSDPALILFMVYWLKRVFGIETSSIRAWLNMYSQQDEKDLIAFWSDLTGIPAKNFGKSYIKPESKNYKKNTLYYGTIQISVPKSTDLQYRIQGLVRGFISTIDPKLKSTILRWEGLRDIQRTINLVEE